MLELLGKQTTSQKDTMLTILKYLAKACLEKRQIQDFCFVWFGTIWDEKILTKTEEEEKVGIIPVLADTTVIRIWYD